MTSTAGTCPRPAGPTLLPLRATTYVAAPGRRLDQVTTPPVEVWDEPTVRRTVAGRPDHVLRLVAPGLLGAGDDRARLVRRWLAAGVLRRADRPALYTWTWEAGGHRVRGVVGTMALPLSGQVAAHEQTRADIVAARAAQLRASGVQVEPLMLLHDGAALAGLDRGDPSGGDPHLVHTLDLGGERHRITRLVDAPTVAAIADSVARARPPVVADGHHRLAALDLQRERAPSAVGRALVLVVDLAVSDLTVGTIHRVLPGRSLDEVLHASRATGVPVRDGAEDAWLSAAAADRLRWLVADGERRVGLELSSAAAHALHPGGSRGSCPPVARETCHLHSHLLPAWGVDEVEVGFLHDWDQARAAAAAAAGVAVRSAAPSVDQVLESARAGHLLPHKATSIGPKPRIGMVMLGPEDSVTGRAAVQA